MGQADQLRGMDATIHSAMLATGIAFTGVYTAGAVTVDPCRGYFDQEFQAFGEVGPVAGARTTLCILLADVAAPKAGARLAIDGVIWILKAEDGVDQSISRWVVSNGGPAP